MTDDTAPPAAEPSADDSYDETRRRLGATFTTGGGTYAALRPGYPREAVDRLLGPEPRRVADVGAGTGKLTEVLLAAGHDVVAVDPSTDMLDRLREAHPEVETRVAGGEATGLPGGEFDAVVYAQAWHWVDPEPASAEARRLLRPGGALGLVWNFMDAEVEWVAELNRRMHSATGDADPRSESAALARGFGPVERFDVRWEHEMTAAALAGLVTTRSYYLDLPDDRRAGVRDRVAEHVAAVFGGVDDRPAALPYVTEVHRFPA